MKLWNLRIIILLVAASMLFVTNAKGQEDKTKGWSYSFPEGGFKLYESEDKDEKLTLGGSILYRYAYWNWFGTDKGNNTNNDYSFSFPSICSYV